MICQRCLLRAARRNAAAPSSALRFLSSAPTHHAQQVTAQTTTGTNSRSNDQPAAGSEPPLEPIKDSPISRGGEQNKAVSRAPSSVPAGAVLKGLNFMKNAQDPLAMADEEYPDWLWGVLEKGKGEGEEKKGEDGDLFSKSKKQRRIAAKALRKQQLLHPEMLQPKIPIYEQSIDLPAGDGTLLGAVHAAESRQELTKAMRDKRRAKIKEANFLKAMR